MLKRCFFSVNFLPKTIHTEFDQLATVRPQTNPCDPSPCGPYSQCHEVNQHAVCSCQVDFIGMPPNCRPECVVSSECAQDKACLNQQCKTPCAADVCASNAICKVVNHNPICSCSSGFTGDPFVECNRIESKIFLLSSHLSLSLLSLGTKILIQSYLFIFFSSSYNPAQPQFCLKIRALFIYTNTTTRPQNSRCRTRRY